MSIDAKVNWLVYWHIKRRAHHALISLVWRLPRRVIYWSVVRAAVAVESDTNPSGITAEQMLKKMEV